MGSGEREWSKTKTKTEGDQRIYTKTKELTRAPKEEETTITKLSKTS